MMCRIGKLGYLTFIISSDLPYSISTWRFPAMWIQEFIHRLHECGNEDASDAGKGIGGQGTSTTIAIVDGRARGGG